MNRLWMLFRQRGFLRSFRSSKRLKLRFAVNQAAAQRHGVDYPKAVVTLELDPNVLSPEDRRRIDQRMLGIDVCEGVVRADGSKGPAFTWDRDTYQDPYKNPSPILLVAELPTLDGLLNALAKDERRLSEAAQIRCQPV